MKPGNDTNVPYSHDSVYIWVIFFLWLLTQAVSAKIQWKFIIIIFCNISIRVPIDHWFGFKIIDSILVLCFSSGQYEKKKLKDYLWLISVTEQKSRQQISILKWLSWQIENTYFSGLLDLFNQVSTIREKISFLTCAFLYLSLMSFSGY